MVAIVDYGVGNLLAVQNIIKKVGGDSVISSDRGVIEKADRLILPGVGSFGYCMEQLMKRNLLPILKDEVFVKKKNILGLCVGAQMMTEKSEEGGLPGLGWVQAQTKKFDESRVDVIPHMGWSDVHFTNFGSLGNGLEESRFYFVHSYHFDFYNQSQVLATANFGYQFPCAFQSENIFGVQFHPEKSHRFGMRLFQNFLDL
jgi:imidazole glycerol-phosphate synthase subunit HisH